MQIQLQKLKRHTKCLYGMLGKCKFCSHLLQCGLLKKERRPSHTCVVVTDDSCGHREARRGGKIWKELGLQVRLQKCNLTLYVPCIILQCVDDQRDAQFL